MERMTARIGRIMGEQQFESMDEAQAFLNNYLSEGGGSLEDAPAPATPLERAQELVYDAFDTDDPQRRVELAEEALQISEDCADAYVLLAEETAEAAEEAAAASPEPEAFTGGDFYAVPDPLPDGEHGDLIRYEQVDEPAAGGEAKPGGSERFATRVPDRSWEVVSCPARRIS